MQKISLILLFISFLFIFEKKVSAKYDTSYVENYKQKLCIAILQSKRNFNVNLSPNSVLESPSTSSRYMAQAPNFSGLQLNFEGLQLTIGQQIAANAKELLEKGKTTTYNLGLNYSSPHIRCETFVRYYQGFYDSNSPSYILDFKPGSAYYQDKDMIAGHFKSKLLYFLNKKKKFSFLSSYNNTQRQLKSCGSFFGEANFTIWDVHSIRPLPSVYVGLNYGNKWANLIRIHSNAYSIAPGYSYNFIFKKKFFLNLTAAIGIEVQDIAYRTAKNTNSASEVRIAGFNDFRTAIGYNAERFFISLTTTIDQFNMETNVFKLTSSITTANFSFGYRIRLFKHPIKILNTKN